MKIQTIAKLATALLVSQLFLAAHADQVGVSTLLDPRANSQIIPRQILKTGVNLNCKSLSPNSLQLSDSIGLTPVLEHIQTLQSQIDTTGETDIAKRQDLWEANQKAILVIQKTGLEIDFAIAEIDAEHQVYQELSSSLTNARDKAVARTNAISFISNGALWAVCEALAIPGYRNAMFAIPSGIIGIPAGVVPSIASMYTFKQLNGKKLTSDVEPNMLAKLFNYSASPEIDYPKSVWQYLNQVPADAPNSKRRVDQLIDRWVSDSNIPDFTDRNAKKELDVLTASVAHKKGLTIATLSTRTVMLQQLHAEIAKMKRLLVELNMAVQGEKKMPPSE